MKYLFLTILLVLGLICCSSGETKTITVHEVQTVGVSTPDAGESDASINPSDLNYSYSCQGYIYNTGLNYTYKVDNFKLGYELVTATVINGEVSAAGSTSFTAEDDRYNKAPIDVKLDYIGSSNNGTWYFTLSDGLANLNGVTAVYMDADLTTSQTYQIPSAECLLEYPDGDGGLTTVNASTSRDASVSTTSVLK